MHRRSDRCRSAIGVLFAIAGMMAAGEPRLAAAVADYLGRQVAVVHLTIEGRDTTDPMLTQVVETLSGEPLSMVLVRSSIAHLFSLGRFEDVRVDASLEGGNVVLRYDLIPIHPVGRIRFVGATGGAGIDEGA